MGTMCTCTQKTPRYRCMCMFFGCRRPFAVWGHSHPHEVGGAQRSARRLFFTVSPFCFCFQSRGAEPLRGGGRAPTHPEIKNAAKTLGPARSGGGRASGGPVPKRRSGLGLATGHGRDHGGATRGDWTASCRLEVPRGQARRARARGIACGRAVGHVTAPC